MYKLEYTNSFKKDVKRAEKRGWDLSLLEKTIDLLQKNGKLPPEYNTHKLQGKKYAGKLECHIKPDWLLVWEQYDNVLKLIFFNIGTHSDLF
ncbi:MAG: type II toxin-antitoxin system YafQ family toxin [Prevotellaceae bacterium]|jgi:mRNA interferase YafQ|nr:type II toxin-antitoxin system YafQ family toxin [Prevotellaceae bacterium]